MRRGSWAGWLLVMAMPGAQAHEWSVSLDNDRMANQDENYTHGLRITRSDDQGEGVRTHWTFGHAFYTPRDPARQVPGPSDHPYAGWLYLERAGTWVEGTAWRRAGLSVGWVGPGTGAKDLHRDVHHWLSSPRFHGWEYQLPNEPTIQYTEEARWRSEPTWFGQTFTGLRVSLGTVRVGARASFTWRWGPQLPDDWGMVRLPEGGMQWAQGAGDTSSSLPYVFIEVAGEGVAHDLFLDGTVWSSSHSVDTTPWVGEVMGGLAWSHGATQVAVVRVERTRTFAQQPRTPGYGSLVWSHRF